jgi:ribosomal protein L11 methyltransferase
MSSWTLTLPCSKEQGEAAALASEKLTNWQRQPVIVTQELAEDTPEKWQMTGYFEQKPSARDIQIFANIIDSLPREVALERLADQDWVTISQSGLEPIRAGRCHVHTPDNTLSDEPVVTNFCIAASLAFGTGHHQTTHGCLMLLDAIRRSGARVDNMLDLGTGTGLLAFAAHILWPRAYVLSSDIDEVCADIVDENIQANGLKAGWRQGEIGYVTADGLDHNILQDRAPYDLIAANILAGPLADMAQDICAALVPGGHLILAGLLTSQYQDVAKAYRRHGMRVTHRLENGDWSILWLRKRITK